ncbi:hypothetical protein NDU88_004677 [Pleurodeles waltl]|uniref:Uncharacterized protein n=1 Tax=Pleurodeles waltl TaxID=8319 RepID=A0AAV7LRP2_PLEWA|nr:hypothetical protein NDU88_004677 [Pleurodeles waltl]
MKAAREAAAMHNKDWILKKIRGDGIDDGPIQEEHTGNRPCSTARDEEKPPSESKKQNSSKGGKKEAGELPEAGAPGPSMRAQANNGWVREAKGSRGTEPRGDTAPSDNRVKRFQVVRAEVPLEQCPSPDRG